MTMTYNPLPMKFISIVLLGIIGIVIVFTMTHALERHGSAASDTINCINQGKTIQIWYNPSTNRYAKICMVGDKFGIGIFTDLGDVVTSFVKDKMTNIDQVMRYLTNAGYFLK